MNISITPKVSFWIFLELLCIPPSHLSMSPPFARAITDLIYIKFYIVSENSLFVFISDFMREKKCQGCRSTAAFFLFWVTSGSLWEGHCVNKGGGFLTEVARKQSSLSILYKEIINEWLLVLAFILRLTCMLPASILISVSICRSIFTLYLCFSWTRFFDISSWNKCLIVLLKWTFLPT